MKRRTLVIGLSTFHEVIQDTIEACKARRGQSIGVVDRLDFPDQNTLFSTLSPKRLELLCYLRNHGSMSDKQLSKQLNTNLKNMQADIKLLSRLGLISTDDSDKYFVPWDDVNIQLPLAA